MTDEYTITMQVECFDCNALGIATVTGKPATRSYVPSGDCFEIKTSFRGKPQLLPGWLLEEGNLLCPQCISRHSLAITVVSDADLLQSLRDAVIGEGYDPAFVTLLEGCPTAKELLLALRDFDYTVEDILILLARALGVHPTTDVGSLIRCVAYASSDYYLESSLDLDISLDEW